MALGPIILGHGHPAVTEAIERQLRRRDRLHAPAPARGRGRRADRRRWCRARSASASEDRLRRDDGRRCASRAPCTGRDRVIVGGYHGWHDWYIGTTSRPTRRAGGGSGARRTPLPFNDLDCAATPPSNGRPATTAAVVLEPVGAESRLPGFLQGVVDRAHAAGALVVFDEIITGFRLAPGGAQERYGVVPDLADLRQSARERHADLGRSSGSAEYMDRLEDVFFSGTHGGETLSLAAANAVLDELTDPRCTSACSRAASGCAAGIQDGIDEAGVGELVSVDGRGAEDGDDRSRAGRAPDGQLLAGASSSRSCSSAASSSTDPTSSAPLTRDGDIDHAVESYRRRRSASSPTPCGRATWRAALDGSPVQPGLPRALMAATKVRFRRSFEIAGRQVGRRRARVRDRRGGRQPQP